MAHPLHLLERQALHRIATFRLLVRQAIP